MTIESCAKGSASLLKKSGNFECVAEADDGYQAVKLAMELRSDIVILDIAMPNLDGIEATRQIKSENCGDWQHNIAYLLLGW